MKYNPDIHHRHSIRLKDYNYTQAGAYFVTIATQGRVCFFGEVQDGEIQLSPSGQMIERWWIELGHKFPTVGLGEYVIMPNHFHGVIIIYPGPVGVDLCVDPVPDAHATPGAEQGAHTGAPLPTNARDIVGVDLRVDPVPDAHTCAPVRASIPTIIQWFKTMTTNEYIRGVKQLGWEPFAGKLWQRNYYEHIIRNEADLQRIEAYILANPQQWEQDQLHPHAAPNKFNRDR